MERTELTHGKLLEELIYFEDTGIFKWRKHQLHCADGSFAGRIKNTGYYEIYILGKPYLSHRLAWLYMTGSFPPKNFDIDHKDGDRANNKWENLRLTTHRINSQNRNINKNNKTGITGVWFNKERKKYDVTLRNKGKNIKLGSYTMLQNAAYARWEAEKKYWGNNKVYLSSAFDYLLSFMDSINYVIKGSDNKVGG